MAEERIWHSQNSRARMVVDKGMAEYEMETKEMTVKAWQRKLAERKEAKRQEVNSKGWFMGQGVTDKGQLPSLPCMLSITAA